MPIVLDIKENSYLRKLYAEGQQEGREEGRRYGEGAILRLQLERRFGKLPDWVIQKLDSAAAADLERWSLRVLDAAALDEVFN